MLDKLVKHWLALALLVASFGTFASPWLFGFSGEIGPAVSASVIGALLALLGLAAAAELKQWAAGGAMAVGAWSLVSPILLGFHDQPAFWSHVAAGVVAMLIGVATAELSGGRPPHSMA